MTVNLQWTNSGKEFFDSLRLQVQMIGNALENGDINELQSRRVEMISFLQGHEKLSSLLEAEKNEVLESRRREQTLERKCSYCAMSFTKENNSYCDLGWHHPSNTNVGTGNAAADAEMENDLNTIEARNNDKWKCCGLPFSAVGCVQEKHVGENQRWRWEYNRNRDANILGYSKEGTVQISSNSI
eukprot:TRINITY_DN10750_c0_g1_i1.p1 TRINITY_DN10750_c0_g1~~TRINITY_DN10750_c0_g1_i1.p1  ORF type:complete len:185 (-),score=17.55 TRINITY_DN10750_c0_g1_i1:50-604(-)